MLRQLHWPPVQRRVEFKIACLVHQSLASTAPTYLSADIHHASEHGRHLRSSSYRSLAFIRTRTIFSDRSFTVAGPHLWNSLPATLRQITAASPALCLTTVLRPSVQSLAMAHVNTSVPPRRQPYWYHPRVVRLPVIGHFQWLPYGHGMFYHNTFGMRPFFPFSAEN